MDPKRFRARLAHCNVRSWNRTHAAAIDKAHTLLSEQLTACQKSRVHKRLVQLRNAVTVMNLDACLEHIPSTFLVSAVEFDELLTYIKTVVKKSPNPRNPKTFLKRRQCTWVIPGTRSYEFGQFNQHFEVAVDQWPSVVRRALDDAKRRSGAPELYTGVHVNLYVDGGVGVAPHSDKEQSMVKGRPIFSYTLLRDPSTPRPFSVYTRNKCKIKDILLNHGDLLVMKNKMQECYLHGVEKQRPFHRYRERINLTVRAFRPKFET